MSSIRHKLPDIDWHTVSPDVVARFFAVRPEMGVDPEEVDRRQVWLGRNHRHGMSPHVLPAYMVRVRRGGREKLVGLEDLVIGDVIALAAGDRVPAAIRVIRGQRLAVDESAVSGQDRAYKSAHTGGHGAGLLHPGSIVLQGQGEGIITRFDMRPDMHARDWRRHSRVLRQHGLIVQNLYFGKKRLGIRSVIATVSASGEFLHSLVFRALHAGIELHCVVPPGANADGVDARRIHRFVSTSATLRHIRELELRNGPCVWLTDGSVLPYYRGVASLGIVQHNATDAEKLKADLLALRTTEDTLQSILYNIL